jgi:hypothetical protein
MRIPFWLKLSALIGLGIFLGTWFAGEATRKLDTDYLLLTIHNDMDRTTALLAGLISESLVTGNTRETEVIINQYVAGWSEFTYVHVLNDKGNVVAEWQKKPRAFGESIRKFEQAIEFGGQQFGVLSVYADMSSLHTAVEEHISSSRRQFALILLSITMFIVFYINYFAFKTDVNLKADE